MPFLEVNLATSRVLKNRKMIVTAAATRPIRQSAVDIPSNARRGIGRCGDMTVVYELADVMLSDRHGR